MGLFGRKEKKEIERLKAQMSPEQIQLSDLSLEIEKKENELSKLEKKLKDTESRLESAKQQIIETDEAALLQSFGIYTPHYNYSISDEYKDALKVVRDKQKEMVKNGTSVTGNNNWQVNGSASKGKKMVKDMQKLLMRAYNAECDDAIEHVKFNNIESCEKKIRSSADAISKLGAIMGISVTKKYTSLKLEELHLMHEYQVKKQDEKEQAKELRQRQREEAKVQKELAESKAKLKKEQSHYTNELNRLREQIAAASGEKLAELESKYNEVEAHLGEIGEQIADVDYREANQRAGYVYVISNIGAFGENVYKIGMTRRLDPMERINELGDASVPFNFDVHAMIFTEDAPTLETALHNAFAERKVNYINQRREFFNVSLQEIKDVIKENYDKTVEFVDFPPAEQYRETLKIKAEQQH